ncbi:GGDEF domain-containing phosphodiesterase [Saccharothrix obliqua]|uniref:GGDEF domain-containing phosphodiesterase n=1 Tax=Saccharothrix obliqua TaxID=2861747 RepID=UPI001C5E5667|nr:GGDEF domain-containing phosphodiesterase [Saccharothrix obliqua]MBW4720424.1 GGDEF domain-containing protein [Saccharothrix obliqua]
MWRRVAHRIPGTREYARWRTARAALRWRARSGPPAPAGPEEVAAALDRLFARAAAAPDAEAVRRWAAALAAHSRLPLTPAELEAQLTVFAEALARQAAGRDPGEWPAQRVGRELAVRLAVTPRSFQDVVELIVPWLETLGDAGVEGRSRVIAGLGGGFSEGVRDRVLGEQLAAAVTSPQPDRPWFDAALDRLPRPACALGPDGTVVRANAALRALLRVDEQGGPPDLRAHLAGPEDRAVLDRALRAAGGDGVTGCGEATVTDPHGVPVARVEVTALRGPGGTCQVFLHDVTASRAWRQVPLPDLDEVTALPEQRDFLHQVQSTMDAAGADATLGLCTLRLRESDEITRRFGPLVRDFVAKAVAARITAAVAGMPATTVGRLDRDTFGVLITDQDSWHGVTDTVRRLVDWVSEPMWIDDSELVLSPAAGVAEARPGSTAGQLLARARAALHTGPEPGGRWRARRRAGVRPDTPHLLAGLADAIDRDELVVAYTPIVRLGDGQVVGAEASTWWQLPDGDRRQIDDLVSLADDIGLTLRWGPWILRRVVAQAARWRRALGEAAPRITVNIPRRMARDRALVPQVETALSDGAVAASQLMLSMPHSAVLQDNGTPLDNLVKLGGLEVPVALEGVGIDFARYDTLTRLFLQSVVIPSQLTATLDAPRAEASRQAVAENLIRISRSVSREVTVKGVRTAAQRETAHKLSAALGQGVLFGGPQPPEDIADLVAAGRSAG